MSGDLRWPLPFSTDPYTFWLLSAVLDWPLLSSNGLLTSAGLEWPLLASTNLFYSQLIFLCPIWPSTEYPGLASCSQLTYPVFIDICFPLLTLDVVDWLCLSLSDMWCIWLIFTVLNGHSPPRLAFAVFSLPLPSSIDFYCPPLMLYVTDLYSLLLLAVLLKCRLGV